MTNSELGIRPATMQDARAIADVHIRSWRATYHRIVAATTLAGLDVDKRATIWTTRLTTPERGEHTLVALLSTLVGFVQFGPSPDRDDDAATTGQIFAIHVDPNTTGRGVGRALLTASLGSLTRASYQRATLWVVAGNDRARRFYELAGWTPDGATRREKLALPGETGDQVTVVRYARQPMQHSPASERGAYHVR